MATTVAIDEVIPDYRKVHPQAMAAYALRQRNVIIDMFYEDGMWSGRVYKLNDEEQRWKSCSSNSYEDTLEMMLGVGLELI